jgi:predicted Rossmann fold nucleotide-binding protein DprA/Smf involved in DNA uptake
MNNNSLAVLLLSNRLVPVDERPFSSREVWNLFDRLPEIGNVLVATEQDLLANYDLEPELVIRAKRLCDAATAFIFEMERLEESGIRVLSFLDESFPQRVIETLGHKSSAFLLVAGNTDLLDLTGRGIVGSRNASAESIEVAQGSARDAVRRGEVVISGLARGIDRVAMSAALDIDGSVVGVPTEGVRIVAKSNEIRNLVHEGKICLVSPYAPDVRFSVGLAMGRNRFVYALSKSTLVVTSDLRKGGTWSGAEEALKGNFAQVDVWTGEGATTGNMGLVDLGARPVNNRDDFWTTSHAPNLNDQDLEPQQLKLF